MPEASQFEKYNSVLPGAAERILKMAETQSSHRQKIEKWAIIGDQVKSMIGLLFGFLIAILGIGGSIYLILKNHLTGGLYLSSGVLTSIVGSFIYGSWQKRKALKERGAKNGRDKL